MFKVTSKDTRTTSMMSSGVFIIDFGHIVSSVSFVNFEWVNVYWVATS